MLKFCTFRWSQKIRKQPIFEVSNFKNQESVQLFAYQKVWKIAPYHFRRSFFVISTIKSIEQRQISDSHEFTFLTGFFSKKLVPANGHDPEGQALIRCIGSFISFPLPMSRIQCTTESWINYFSDTFIIRIKFQLEKIYNILFL